MTYMVTRHRQPWFPVYQWIQQTWHRSRWTLLALVAYAILTVAVTYPVAFKLDTAIAGLGDDSVMHLWTLWWGKKAMLERGTSMADLTYFYYPRGAYHPLLSMTPLIQITALPLVLLFKPLVAYNLTFLSTYILTAFTTYLLCHHVTQYRWAAFIGGLIFGFAPTRQIHALGHLAQIYTYWFPLYALALLRFVERPNWKRALGAGILLGISSLVNFVHTAHFVFIFTLCWLLYLACTRPRWVFSPVFLKLAALLFGVAAVIVVPLYAPYFLAAREGSVHYIMPGGATSGSTNPFSFVLPSPRHPLVQALGLSRQIDSLLGPNPIEGWAYLGLVPVLLALWGVLKARARTGFWLVYLLTSAVLSLGPLLRVGQHLFVLDTVDGLPVHLPLPYILLRLIPLFRFSRTPARIAIGTPLALSVLVSLGMVQLVEALKHRQRSWIGPTAALLTGVILFEYTLAFPYVYSDAPVPAFYAQVRQEGGDGAIADHPLNTGIEGDAGRFARALYYQTVHERPIAGGKSWRIIEEGRATTQMVHTLIAPDAEIEPDIYAAAPDRERAAWLSELGFEYVVLHKFSPSNIYDWRGQRPPEQVEVEKQHLTKLLSASIYEDRWIIAFRVPAAEILEPGARPLLAFTHGWTDVQKDDQGRLYRGMAQQAAIEVYTPLLQTYRLAFDAYSSDEPHRLSVSLDGQVLLDATIDQAQTYESPPITLQPGRSTLELETTAPCQTDRRPCQTLSFLRLDWQGP